MLAERRAGKIHFSVLSDRQIDMALNQVPRSGVGSSITTTSIPRRFLFTPIETLSLKLFDQLSRTIWPMLWNVQDLHVILFGPLHDERSDSCGLYVPLGWT